MVLPFLFPSLCLLGGILIGGGGTLRAVRLFGLAPPFSFSFQGRLGHQLDQCSHLLLSHPCFTETLSSFLQDGITVFREVLRKNLWKLHLLKNINLELKCKNNLRCRSPKHGPSWAIGFTSLTHQHLPTSALAEQQGSIGRRRLQIASHHICVASFGAIRAQKEAGKCLDHMNSLIGFGTGCL